MGFLSGCAITGTVLFSLKWYKSSLKTCGTCWKGNSTKIYRLFLLRKDASSFKIRFAMLGHRWTSEPGYIVNGMSIEVICAWKSCTAVLIFSGGLGKVPPRACGVATMAWMPSETAWRAMATLSSILEEPSSARGSIWQCISIKAKLDLLYTIYRCWKCLFQ